MQTTFIERKKAFAQLGAEIAGVLKNHAENGHTDEAYAQVMYQSERANGWFTYANQLLALEGIVQLLLSEASERYLQEYEAGYREPAPKKVAVVPAGNIPAVGFADMMAVLLSGHIYYAKCSSSDLYWLPFLAGRLCTFLPALKEQIIFETAVLKDFEAAIATGSNNTARYFEYYFGKYPSLIRKNRTSCAVLSGNESAEDLRLLQDDMFSYFGMGCRNVTFLLAPQGYDWMPFMAAGEHLKTLRDHTKYSNNYDYYKSIYLLNRDPIFDNEAFMLRPMDRLGAPVSVVHYREYENPAAAEAWLRARTEEIQCVAGSDGSFFERGVSFGNTQKPELSDWPDGKNVLEFLTNIG